METSKNESSTRARAFFPGVSKINYSLEEAAYALGISERSVRYLIAEKQITPRYHGRRVLVPVSEVQRVGRRTQMQGEGAYEKRPSEEGLSRNNA